MVTVTDVTQAIRQFSNYWVGEGNQVGYKFWGGGPLEPYAPMWTADDWSLNDVWADPYANCSGIINVGRHLALGRGCFKSGTKGYGDWIKPWEDFVPYKPYPVGTLLIQPYIHGVSEGHIAIVSTHSQYILQSTSWYGGWYPGITEDKTVMDQHYWTPWKWAGFMPDCLPPEYLGPKDDPVGDLSRYPGDTAAIKDTARWMAYVAETEFGLPGILPVMCSCVELTCAWASEGDVKNCPGYLYAVDHDSLGHFQQRPSQGWGTVKQLSDPNYTLRKFLSEAKKLEGQFNHTPTGLGLWCQAVQRSAFPHAYRDKGYPMAMRILGEVEPIKPVPVDPVEPVKPIPPEEDDVIWSKYNLCAVGQPATDFANAAQAALESVGIDTLTVNAPGNIEIASGGAKNHNDITKMNCLVIGKGAVEHLAEGVTPAWTATNPVWSLYADDDAGTLKRVRDWAIPWIAKTEQTGQEGLRARFEDILLAIDGAAYGKLLADADDPSRPDPPAPPPPPKPSPTLTLEERVAKLEEEVAKLRGEG